ncbi:MAG: Kazal-type serine protease inhibitor family protein [archaeon]|nr:Kazal-type serine protease inhibitor family protein [archaeon]
MEKIKLTKLLTLITLTFAILASPVIAQSSTSGSGTGESCRGEDYACYIGNLPCCSGLKEVPLSFESSDGQCIAANCGSICRPCGNGICDENENKCNCPQDCKPEKDCYSDKDCEVTSTTLNQFCEFPEGTCRGPGKCTEKPGICPTLYDPVCGCDSKTYSNDCARQVAGVSKRHDGKCERKLTCSDTDGGRDYYKKGTVSLQQVFSNGMVKLINQKTDYCEGFDTSGMTDIMVLEYYCENNEIKSEIFKCSNGCRDGACIKEDKLSIRITNPINGQTVSGIVPVKATASGPNKLNDMYLLIPGSGGKEIIQKIPLKDCVYHCKPVCQAIGTRAEGWYDSCSDQLIKYATCAGCTAGCAAVGTRSENWHDSCNNEIIRYENCDKTPYSVYCTYKWDSSGYAGEKVTLTASITDTKGNEARDSVTVKVSGEPTCNQKCKSLGYAFGTCRSWAIYPGAEQCKADEINIGHTADCKIEPGIVGIGKGCCCKKATSGASLHMSTDKYTYRPRESVKITARISIQDRVIQADEFKVKADIYKPDGRVETIQLANSQSCICAACACEQGTECNCAPFCSCTYTGTYYGTRQMGDYIISPTATGAGGEQASAKTRFKVTDSADYPPKITSATISPNTPTATKKFKVHMSAMDDIGLRSTAFYKVREPIHRIGPAPVKGLTTAVTSSDASGGGQGAAVSATTTAQLEPITAYAEPSTGAEEDESTGMVLVDEAPESGSAGEPTEEEVNRPELVQSELIAYRYAHNCDGKTRCEHTWTVTETQPGRHTYKFVAYDTRDQKAIQYKTFYVQPLQTKYVHLNEKFDLHIGETAHVIDYNNMRLRLNNIMYPRCATAEQDDSTDDVAARCIGEKPIATLEIINPRIDTLQTSTATILRMSAGETKEVFGARITLVQLDSKKGIFIIRKATHTDFVDIKISPDTRTISYHESAEYKITVTDKHPQLMVDTECDESQQDCPATSVQPLYTYDIIVTNLPFQKQYPKTIILAAGDTETFELKVTPFHITITQQETQISKAVANGNTITAKATAHPVEVAAPSVKIRPRKKYTFSVTAKQKNSPYVRDTDHATLIIKPEIQPPMPPGEETTIQLYKGWNLISLPGKLIQFMELTGAGNKKLLGFVYLPKEKKYVTIKQAREILGSEFYEYLAKHAFWIYSYDDSKLRIKINRNVSYNELELYSGWNLLPVTEDMVGGYLKEIKGTCEFEKLYKWVAKEQSWKKIEEDYQFQESEINYGIAIKAIDYCRLGGGNIIEPPAMPEE